jgi:hypothetical protein
MFPMQKGETIDEIYTLNVKCVDGAYFEDDYLWSVEVSSHMTLLELHDHIQMETGFENDHLAAFFTARDRYARKRTWLIDPERDTGWDKTLAEIFPVDKNRRLFYLFDFGDQWIFSIGKRAKSKQPKPREYYPNVIKIKGTPPKQYPDFDED